MKGIMEQIRERGKVYKLSDWDLKEFHRALEKAQEEDIKARKRATKAVDDNYKHLIKRSKELNKEIPLILLCYASQYPCYVGSGFMKQYKEWL